MSHYQNPASAIIDRANQIAARHLAYRKANPLPAATRPLRFRLGEVLRGPVGYWFVEAVDHWRGTYTLSECDSEGDPADSGEVITETDGLDIASPRWSVRHEQPRLGAWLSEQIGEYGWWVAVLVAVLLWLVVWN